MNAAMPHFALMHEMTTDHVHEEIQLLANDFSSMLMETVGHVPAWRDYYLDHDQTPHYQHLRTQLQAMQFLRGGRRWLLKSPQHLEQLPVLERVFPGADRGGDPPRPGAGDRLDVDDVGLHRAHASHAGAGSTQISTYWVDRLELMLDALVRDRDAIPADRSIDVRFDEFMADDLAHGGADLRAGRGTVDRRGQRSDERLPRRPSARPARRTVATSAAMSVWTRPTCGGASRRTSSAS